MAKPITWRVGLSIVPSSDNQIRMMRGVLDFARDHPEFAIIKNTAIPYIPIASLKRGLCDGVVAYAETRDEIASLIRIGLPAVNVTLHEDPCPSLPVVHSNNRMIGRLAAEHLLEIGLKNFAFCGHFKWHHNSARLAGFRDMLATRGLSCQAISAAFLNKQKTGSLGRVIDRQRLVDAISRLSSPIGVAAAHDEFAFEVIEGCRKLGRRVPHDVAVIGVNDYRLICETTDPPLTSVRQRSEEIGYKAASLLLRRMRGEPVGQTPVSVDPEAIVVRRSSDFLAISDTLVAASMEYIRANCHHPVHAEDVARRAGLARRTLDKRFQRALGQSVAEELRLARIRRAKELLTASDLDIVDIAVRCGFDSKSGFTRAFHRETGRLPSAYRATGIREGV